VSASSALEVAEAEAEADELDQEAGGADPAG
jgi:hypothetical protein